MRLLHLTFFLITYFVYEGQLVKEKQLNSRKASTYFIKVIVDDKWASNMLNSFSNKLADYSIKIKEYIDAYKEPDLQENANDDPEMDSALASNDVSSSQRRSQSNFPRNIAPPNVQSSLNDVGSDRNASTILPITLHRKSIDRPPLLSVDLQQTQNICSPTTVDRFQLTSQSEDHAHNASSVLSSPSTLSIMTSKKSSTKSATKRLRFELNEDD